MDQITILPPSDYIYGEKHEEQESEVRFALSLILSSLPCVFRPPLICVFHLRTPESLTVFSDRGACAAVWDLSGTLSHLIPIEASSDRRFSRNKD